MEPDSADRIAASLPWLDQVADRMLAASEPILGPDAPKELKDALYGTWLGHPLHPAVVALPVGCWTATSIFDLIGEERAADATLNLGLASAGLAALSGLAQWRDATNDEAPRRLGALHAILNTAGTALYLGSSIARRNGNRTGGIALSTMGLAVTMASGWIGGELAYDLGVGVDRNVFESPPEDWVETIDAGELAANTPVRVMAGEMAVLLYRDEHGIHAIGNTCSHYGGPLNEGAIENDCVECPWHGSVFRLSDGAVVHGPATSPQPLFEATERNGKIAVRLVKPERLEMPDASGMSAAASSMAASATERATALAGAAAETASSVAASASEMAASAATSVSAAASSATAAATSAASSAATLAGSVPAPDLATVRGIARDAADRVIQVIPGQGGQNQGQGQGQGHDRGEAQTAGGGQGQGSSGAGQASEGAGGASGAGVVGGSAASMRGGDERATAGGSDRVVDNASGSVGGGNTAAGMAERSGGGDRSADQAGAAGGDAGNPLDARASGAGSIGVVGDPDAAPPPRYEDSVAGNGTAECPSGFPIKGNADSGIYHQPHQGTYERTIAEFCFKSPEAAEAAGYRALGQR